MKTNLQMFFVIALLLANSSLMAQIPERKGWWKFDNEMDLFGATIGNPIQSVGEITSVLGPEAGNIGVQVKTGQYLKIDHGIAPNGGGTLVNEYSIQIDFSVPQVGVWNAIFQTNIDNADDAELFINTQNMLGAWRIGYSTNPIEADTWYRMLVTVKNGEFYRIYVDTTKWVEGTFQALDERDALAESLLFFADNDGEDATINCSELAIWDVALTAEQVAQLGDVNTVGIKEPVYTSHVSELKQNCPNPFSAITTFNYQIKESGNVSFQVYNSIGQLVKQVNHGFLMPGEYQLELNAEMMKNGVYYVQMRHNNQVSNVIMTVVK